MKYFTIYCLAALVLFSCDKEKDPGIKFDSGKINGILFTPKDATFFNYLYVNNEVIYRNSSIKKDYPFSNLRQEKDCYLHIKNVLGNVTGHTGPAFYMQLHDKPNIYIRTAFSPADNAYFLKSKEFEEGLYSLLDRPFSIDDDPSYMFIIHKMGKDTETGMDMIAIESVSQRNHYVDNRGLAIQGMALVALTYFDKPEKAYRWLVGKP